MSEPAILVKRKGKGSQVWSMEKLENKLIDMRELYEDWKDRGEVEVGALGLLQTLKLRTYITVIHCA